QLAAEKQDKLNAAEANLKALNEQVGNTERERDVVKTELNRTSSDLETSQALRRTDHHQNEQLKINLLQTSRSLAGLQSSLETLRQQKFTAENQVVKTRQMLSFQLGYSLLHGFKSWRSFKQLPAQLLTLRREAKRRKSASHLLKTPKALQAPSTTSSTMHKELAFAEPVGLAPFTKCTAQALLALKVACIMDEFTFSSYSPECNLLQLSVLHWQTELTAFRPELLFIESAWRGKDDQWGSKVGHISEEVVGILAWCRQNQIPTVFWNKEDPVHFETFLSTAKMFDYVFTSDIDCIHRYKAALGHERIYLLPFACQPRSSNPIEKFKRKDGFCFARAYYVRYPERTRDLGNFMTALSEYRPVEIYDRNHGKADPNYQFPPEYQPFIVGNLPFDQIDKAYKGYRYAINLNSIKQSQSMFARRVFDLLASNTVTVSNFSRGVRLLFGDLVITTDSGSEIVRRLKALGDETQMRKFRLAGLRKVMMNHTYQDRLAYVVSKVTGKPYANLLPGVVVTAYAKNQQQFDCLLGSFNRQSYADRRIVVVVPGGFNPELAPASKNVQILTSAAIDETSIGGLIRTDELVAGMVPDDYYGPNYLLDLAIATRYSTAQGIGKVTHHVWSESVGLNLAFPGCQYLAAKSIPARCALVRSKLIANMSLREWVTGLYTFQVKATELLGVDEFNYCKNGSSAGCLAEQLDTVNDLKGFNQGITAEELFARSERIAPEEAPRDDVPVLTGEQLATYFKPPANKGYRLTISGSSWDAESTLADGKHEYLYATNEFRAADLGFETHAKFYLDTTPGLNIQLVIIFLDTQKQRISHVIKSANRNHEANIPPGTHWIRLGLRFYSSGAARINGLVLGHRPLQPTEVLGIAEHLVLTNHYPSYDDLYRNGFVHTRVAAYAEHGVPVDVFRLRVGEPMSHHEFHNIDVMTGSQVGLHKLLTGGKYKSVLVHFLDEAMWEVLQHHIAHIKIVVWVHGAEIQPWHRRDFNHENEEQRTVAKIKSDKRMSFWRELLRPIPANLKLVFVSRYFAEEVMEDLGFRIPQEHFTIIHNPINTDLFNYLEKPIEQRKKVLSIRPYASLKYANDLSVKAIQLLSNKPWFSDMDFRMIGDGPLFEETLAPLRKFPNVYIEQRFLKHDEIAIIHKEYGIHHAFSKTAEKADQADK
ncbi:MAG: glycosyltransferase, partial [Polaromonas sp.]|nr:glycosyltransferase [Polaromonas sp.]